MSLAEALATGDLSRLPSRRDEDWRWSDLRGLIRVAPPPSMAWDADLPDGPFAALEAERITLVNGRGPDALAIAPGETRTFALRLVAAPNSGAHLARVRIDVGAGATLTLLESHEGLGAEYLVETDFEVVLAEGARMERVVVTSDAESGVSVTIAQVKLSARARFSQILLTSGARRQRLETQVTHPGRGAEVRLDGIYELGDRRHADITTSVTHKGAGGATSQLTKGVVSGQARGVFQGRIVVREGADQTDACPGALRYRRGRRQAGAGDLCR
jgi:Fe-S cluster assembly protein SufD